MNTLVCEHTGIPFAVSEEDQIFYDLFGVTHPNLSPIERLKRRLVERNARCLYSRECSFSKKRIISQYHADHAFPVYDNDIWWSDMWDASEYAQSFDFSRPFFEQFAELKHNVPHLARYIISGTVENSRYTNCTGYLKDCYLIFESDYNESCMYSSLLKNCDHCFDCSVCYKSQWCYQCIDCTECYELQYSQDCRNCHTSWFLKDCNGCQDCIGCINLRNKQYCIFNQQYSKEAYEQKKQEFQFTSQRFCKEFAEQVQSFWRSHPHLALHTLHTTDSLGDHLYQSKQAQHCYDSKDLENCRYCNRLSINVKDSMDYNSWGDNAQLIYYSAGCGDNAYMLRFCSTCTSNVSYLDYSFQCMQSSYLFGCAGMKRKEYCVLNQSYTKHEYELLTQKIISHMKETGEWGQYFPTSMTEFAYNETIAMDEFPLKKAQALPLGYTWRDEPHYQAPDQILILPDTISQISPQIVSQVLYCFETSKPYKILIEELQFYKKMQVALPDQCPDIRHRDRSKQRNQSVLYEANCAATGESCLTTYAPGNDDDVMSVEAYEQYVR